MNRENSPLYRLRVIDVHGTAYVVVGSKGDLGHVFDWLENDIGSMWLRLSGFDDDVDRQPIQIIIARESIAGMLMSRL